MCRSSKLIGHWHRCTLIGKLYSHLCTRHRSIYCYNSTPKRFSSISRRTVLTTACKCSCFTEKSIALLHKPKLYNVEPIANPKTFTSERKYKPCGTISFTNRGAYVARYRVMYNLNGNVMNSYQDAVINKTVSFIVPSGTRTILVEAMYVVLGSTTFDTMIYSNGLPSNSMCFKTTGTISNPVLSACN